MDLRMAIILLPIVIDLLKFLVETYLKIKQK